MSDADQQFKKLLALFQVEAHEHLEKMNQVLLELETNSTTTTAQVALDDLFRAAHSLKGAARTVQAYPIEQVAHAIESVFDAIRKDLLELTPDVADVLYDSLDAIEVLLKQGEFETKPVLETLAALTTATASKTSGGSLVVVPEKRQKSDDAVSESVEKRNMPATSHPTSDVTIRVPIARIDTLMTDVSNILVSRMNIEQRSRELAGLREQYQQWQQQWRRFHTHYIRLLRDYEQQAAISQDTVFAEGLASVLDFLQKTQHYMRTAGHALAETEQALRDDSLTLGLMTDTLQANVRNVRLLPFETILNMLQRTVRDLARDLGKEVVLQTVGVRVELDKQVLEALKDPLIHVLRNAVDHGIEPPAERVAAGKPRQGVVLLSLLQRGSKVHILVSDDGRGINLELVEKRARDLGILNNETEASLTQNEVMGLLLQPGMSTTSEVSQVSGRGVGLDVVREHIEALQGELLIRSMVQKGSTFEIIVPASLSTMHCLLVEVSHELYALPTNVIVRVLRLDSVSSFTVQGQPMITVDKQSIPLAYLADILERPRATVSIETDDLLVIVLSVSDQLQAFIVNDIISEQEMVVRKLNHELVRVRNISGATLLADGRVVLILNPNDLIRSAAGSHRRQIGGGRTLKQTDTVTKPQQLHILVVDDSITTRTLQKNILEAAGYQVFTATHGIEALEILANHPVSLVLSDIEMPMMNGFDLTERIRQQPTLAHLPIILVTSLDAAEHKERGIRAGADAYIPKGVFDQNKLLETINRLL